MDPISHYVRGDTLVRMKRFAETEVAPDDALAAAPGCIAPTASKLHPVLRVSGDPLRSNARFAALLQVPSGQKK